MLSVLIRGGGSQADLDWFNNILPAESICNSKIPVMVGIGHERDSTVLDEICTKRFDTPSKVINFIANTILDNAQNAKYNYESIIKITKNLAKQNQAQLDNLYKSFKINIEHYLGQAKQNIEHNYATSISISKGIARLYANLVDTQYRGLTSSSQNLIKQYQNNVENVYGNSINTAKNITKQYTQSTEYLYKQILAVSIAPTLKRGFCVTKSQDGKFIINQKQARKYSNLEIVYNDGQVKVEVPNGNTK